MGGGSRQCDAITKDTALAEVQHIAIQQPTDKYSYLLAGCLSEGNRDNGKENNEVEDHSCWWGLRTLQLTKN